MTFSFATSHATAPPTCQTLADLGVNHTGTYFVDPDGVFRGDPPIEVLCDMSTGESCITVYIPLTYAPVDHPSIFMDASIDPFRVIFLMYLNCCIFVS